MSTVRRVAGWGGILALAFLFPLGARALVTEGSPAARDRGATTVDRLGPRAPSVVSARAPRARLLSSRFAAVSLAAGVVLVALALGGTVGGRNRGAPPAAGRSRAPPALHLG